ncbi:MAG: RecQ family ATP-dependent DNA helicase [Acidimicrobiales bacterium]
MVAVPPITAPFDPARASTLLHDLAGPAASLRPAQSQAIEAVLAGRRVLLVQRTGFGKSAVYFLATRLLRDAGAGPTLVVSPLLALMRDQIAAARRMGVAAETINSSNPDDWSAVSDRLANDDVDLLAISPERLNSAGFVANVLPSLAARVGLLVIDEAHCISQWGHDFRVDYRRIGEALARLAPGTPVVACTATAPGTVVTDVAEQLGGDPLVLRGTLDRESLSLRVITLHSMPERLAWLAEQLPHLPGTGIVYCLTVAAVEATAAWLGSRGLDVAAYTGQTEPADRLAVEARLRGGELKAVIATSALGMGYDGDLGFVVHVGAPSSITAYYQAVGRAGRATDHAEAILLPGGAEDARIWHWFESTAFPPRHLAEEVVGFLERARRPASEPAIESAVDIRRGRLSSMLRSLDVEGAVARVPGGWLRTSSPWTYDEERFARVRAARERDAAAVLDYQVTTTCRMAFLRRALDDPELASPWVCGRCDNCTAPDGAVAPDPATVDAARRSARKGDVVLEARKQWPAGLDEPKGRIPASQRPIDGRALAQAGDAGWWGPVDAVLRTWNGDASQLDDELLRGVANVLRRWGWPGGRPTWVTWVPSVARPGLSETLGRRLAEIGHMEPVAALERIREAPPQAEMGNSAHACANVWGAWRLRDAVPSGPVLLVDDTWSSGWTITVIAQLLASGGSGPVHPFVLART